MSAKPDDIPQDVWDAASSAFFRMDPEGASEMTNPEEPIARAILAERERCAGIVGLYADHPHSPVIGMIADEIAVAIRAGGK